MATNNREPIDTILELLKAGLGLFVEREFERKYPGRGVSEARKRLGEDRLNAKLPMAEWDVAVLLKLMCNSKAWQEVFCETLGPVERGLVSELREVRNRWAHQKSFPNDDAERALDSAARLLKAVSALQQADEVRKMWMILRSLSVAEPPSPGSGQGPEGPPTSSWLKMIGFGVVKDPCPKVYRYNFVDFPKQKRPSGIQVGDRMILYACGGSKHIFADATVKGEVCEATWPPSEPRGKEWRTRFPHRMNIAYTVNLPVASGVQIAEINTPRRDLGKCIRGASYLRLYPEEYRQAAARLATESWLKVVDAGEYQASWEQAAKLFKGAVTQEQWVQVAKGTRAPLGKLVSRKVKSRQYTEKLPDAPDGEYVVIQFDSAFENKASAVETATPMLDPDGVWRVSGYYIR